MNVEVGNFLIERERAIATRGQHAHDFLIVQADEIGVLSVKLVHEPVRGGRLVLRNFLHERPVVETMDHLELPVFGSEFEHEGRTWLAHGFVCCGLSEGRRLNVSTGNCSTIFSRCANRISAARSVTRKVSTGL